MDALCGQALHRKNNLAEAARAAFVEVRYRSPDHRLNDFSLGKLGGRPLVDEPAVAQDRDAVRQVANLAHPVGDVDDRDAVVSQAPHHAEQALRLVLRQRRGGFVEGQHLQAAAKRAHDLHELSLSRAEVAGAGPGAEFGLEAELGEQAPSAPRKVGAIEE